MRRSVLLIACTFIPTLCAACGIEKHAERVIDHDGTAGLGVPGGSGAPGGNALDGRGGSGASGGNGGYGFGGTDHGGAAADASGGTAAHPPGETKAGGGGAGNGGQAAAGEGGARSPGEAKAGGGGANNGGQAAAGEAGARSPGEAKAGGGGANNGGQAGAGEAGAGNRGQAGAGEAGAGNGGQAGAGEAGAGNRGQAGSGEAGAASAVVAGGAGGQPGSGPALQFVAGPSFEGHTNDLAPLAGTLRVETNLPSTGSVSVVGGGETWSVTLASGATLHEQPMIGFKPDTIYEFTATASDPSGQIVSAPAQWRSPALPAGFPTLELVQSDPSRMEPGMTLFDVRPCHYIVVADAMGQVRWYYHFLANIETTRLLSNGNLMFVSQYHDLFELDWFGNTVTRWYATKGAAPAGSVRVAANYMSHSASEMPNGNLVALSREDRTIDNYPSSTSNRDAPPKTATVRGDVIVEFTWQGEIVKELHLLDILDPRRVGYEAVSSGVVQDWSHGNSVVYDENSDAYVVSLRHQDAVVKVARETGELVWILGDHANWEEPWQSKLLTPVGEDFRWQYHQHAAEVIPIGIGLYDNHNHGASAFNGSGRAVSRAVKYAIDEEQMTVAQAWSYEPLASGKSLFSQAMSDADWLGSTGNELIASGSLERSSDPPGWAQILEVTEDGTSVFELNVLDSPDTLTVFGASRIPDIRYMQVE
ncbi:MAG: aryl-sulfate sulfotransferase [Polyangiaceae bacterium]|nr:aryl-sulfate sulfotransferase [Polyangiaceae bacterium]